MTVLAAGAISITDGAILIAAKTVALRLGLKPEALHAEMQCLVETGLVTRSPDCCALAFRTWQRRA
jgi:hypothetical protein